MGKKRKTNRKIERSKHVTRSEWQSLAHRVVSTAMAFVLALGMAPTLAFADPTPDSGANAPGTATSVSQAPAVEANLQAGSIATDALADDGIDPSKAAADPTANSNPAEAATGAAADADPAAALSAATGAGSVQLGTGSAEGMTGATAPSLNAQASLAEDDPFYFKDYETGQLVTTLHTSGTYVLVQADGTPYLGSTYPYFEPFGSTARPNYDGGFRVATKSATLDGGIECQVLEDLSSAYKAKDMMLPSGLYRIRISGNTVYDPYLSQRYRVINDGVFCPQFENGAGSNYTEDFCGISVKPYTAGKSDDDYDGYYYDEANDWAYTAKTPNLSTFALASDTRLSFAFESAMPIDQDTVVQIESIDLWKADGTMADYQPLPEGGTDDDESSYRNMNRSRISRIPDLGFIPSWPNYLNFNDDAKIVHLWSREDGELDVRTNFFGDVADGDVDEGTFIVDHANFAAAVAESGVYFPIVKATIGKEAYTVAYYPIQVDATGTAERANPSIAAMTLENTRVGVEYAAQLKGRSGAKVGTGATFSWAVTAGALPAGLTLNADTGVISGTPTEKGIFNFRVTLTETLGGNARTTTRNFELRVGEAVTAATAFEHLSLGEIQYEPGTYWLNDHWNSRTYLDFTIPISLDVRDESLDLSETEVWCLVKLTEAWRGTPYTYLEHARACDIMNEDGTALELPILVSSSGRSNVKAFNSLRVFLVPQHNDGSIAFDPGPKSNDGTYSDGEPFYVKPIPDTLAERYSRRGVSGDDLQWAYTGGPRGDYAEYLDLPEMPYAALDNPDIQFGSWLHFPSLSFEGDVQPTIEGRVRIWSYNGTTTPGADMQELGITQAYGRWDDSDFTKEQNGGANFKVAPGTFAFTVEGAVPVYDEFGQAIEGEKAWVDIAGSMEGARPLRGTHPKQYLITVGPNEGTDTIYSGSGKEQLVVGITYTGENIMAEDIYSANVTFEQEDGSYAEGPGAQYQVSWYRRTGADASTDVLVATGEHVSFGTSDYPLYVEAMPTGRTTSFWKTSSRQLVPTKNKVASVKVPRKQLFTGTFALSCESGKTPKPGDYWGILEVKTPLEGGGYTTFNVWAGTNTVSVPGLTSGSVVTFTPNADLAADEASYTVPDSTQANFTQALVAPMTKGTISFEGLSFTGVDGTTEAISFDDGYTGLKVERLSFNPNGSVAYACSIPHRQLDGSRIVLQPEEWYGDYYLNQEATYRLTVTHRDPNAPARMGSNASEYAAKQAFEVALSPSQTSATIEAATLTSRGYADISLANPGNKACTLLLYDGEGNFVEKASAGTAAQLRTPFLDAGSYELYAVDAGSLPDQDTYSNKGSLENRFQRDYPDRISDPLTFTIQNAKITRPEGGLTLPDWSARELVDRTVSSVSATASFSDKVTITMHAELNEGVTLSGGAYLVIATNQPSGDARAGFMNPDALNLNGKAIALNRWSNLFNTTQHMYRGNLEINLSAATEIDATCGRFPLDMTLVIPRRNMEGIEASVWLVDRGTRSLVGTYEESSQEISLSVPPVAAWKAFYVYGETAPKADVTVYLSGMRAATARADEYGYYTAEITLPDVVEEFQDFTLIAAAQWTRGDVGYAVTSEAQTATYSTTFPALERITMCYQSKPGSTYDYIETYYRGKMPDKYATIYRAENEYNSKEGDDHAKYFWIVEYANGDIIDSVDFGVPRSDGSTVKLSPTESLQTAESWIPDAKMRIDYADPRVLGGALVPGSEAGERVHTALTTNDLRSFVTRPEYFSYSPDELLTAFDFEEPEPSQGPKYPLEGVTDLGRFEGASTGGLAQEELSTYLTAMSNTCYARLCSDEEAATLANEGTITWSELAESDAQAAALQTDGANVAGWILVSWGVRQDEHGNYVNPLLRVHFDTQTQDMTSAQIAAEIQEIMNGAQPAIDSFEGWAVDGKDQTVTQYKGNLIWAAGSTELTGDESIPYLIITGDGDTADSNVQVEMLSKYYIETAEGEPTGKYMYQLARMDKSSMQRIVFDELNDQRTVSTLTIAEDQVYEGAAGMWDIVDQWNKIQSSLLAGFNDGAFAVQASLEGGEGGSGAKLSGQSVPDEPSQAVSDEPSQAGGLTLSVQWPSLPGDPVTSEFAGYNIGNGIVDGIDYAWAGKQSGEEIAQEIRNDRQVEGLNDLNPDKLAKRYEPGYVKEKFDRTLNHLRTPIENGVGSLGAVAMTGGVSATTVPAMIYGQSVPANNKCFWKWYDDTFKGDPPKWFEDPDDVDNIKKQSDLEKTYHNYLRLRAKNASKKDWKDFMKANDMRVVNWCQQKYLLRTGLYKKQKRKQNKGAHDPSGIVYEAVLSNPVEGATVKLFTYNPTGSTYGLDEATFIDSTQFGIEDNPQVTGADGRYQWFVPEGYWQVRVTKDGYTDLAGRDVFSTGDWGHQEEVPVLDGNYEPVLDASGQPTYKTVWVGDYGIDGTKDFNGDGVDDASSYWMPVLPIQLDVNIPLRSLEAPAIKSVEATADGLIVTFTKYLQPATVTGAMFAVALGDSQAAVPMGAVKPLDLEAAGDGSDAEYASTFLVTASTNAAYPESIASQLQKAQNNLTVTLTDAATAARSYAGTAVSDTTAHAVVLDLRPSIVSVDIADVWTQLSAVDPVQFTAAVTAARDSDGNSVSTTPKVQKEQWTCEEAGHSVTSPNSFGAKPRGGYTYRYTIELASADDHPFSNALAVSYSGVPLAAGTYKAKASEDGMSVVITGLVSDVAVAEANPVISAVHIEGATLSYAAGDKPRFTAKLADADLSIAYEAFIGEFPNGQPGARKYGIDSNGTALYDGAIESFSPEATYVDNLLVSAPLGFSFAQNPDVYLNGKFVANAKVELTEGNPNYAVVTLPVTVSKKQEDPVDPVTPDDPVAPTDQKAANPMTASAKAATHTLDYNAKATQTIEATKAYTVAKNQGALTYSKKSGDAGIAVAANGDITVKAGLGAGSYKVVVTVKAAGNAKYNAATKDVTFTVKIKPKAVKPMVKLSKKSFAYTGKVRKPTVNVKADGAAIAASGYTVTWPKGCKTPGAYKVKVTLKGNYSGTATATYKIVPKATKLSKVVSASKGFTVKWKKQAKQTTGYQVQYSLKKNFKSAKTVTVKGAKKTSKKIGKLKAKKKYYVRVRTYKTVKKVKYYSSWTKAKTVKTKA